MDAQRLGRRFRQAACSGGGGQRAHAPKPRKGVHPHQPHSAGQQVIHAALGRVQIGVHTDGRNAPLGQPERQILGAQLFQRMKNHRVMAHDQAAALLGCLPNDRAGHLQRREDSRHRRAAVHQQARIVPALGQVLRGPLLHKGQHLAHRYRFHGQAPFQGIGGRTFGLLPPAKSRGRVQGRPGPIFILQRIVLCPPAFLPAGPAAHQWAAVPPAGHPTGTSAAWEAADAGRPASLQAPS